MCKQPWMGLFTDYGLKDYYRDVMVKFCDFDRGNRAKIFMDSFIIYLLIFNI